MNLVITGKVGVALLRAARLRSDLGLAPATLQAVPPVDASGRDVMGHSGVRELVAPLLAAEDPAIGIRVASSEERILVRGLSCSVTEGELLPNSLLRVCDTRTPFLDSPIRGVNVYVDAPGLMLLGRASELNQLVSSGRMSNLSATAELMGLGCELCGTYSFEPGHDGGCGFGLDPLATSSEVSSYLAASGGRHGAKLARRAAKMILDGSASPMESILGLMLSNPPRYGGVSLTFGALNRPIDLSNDPRGLLMHRSMRPDIRFDRFGISLEYNGRDSHAQERSMRDDKLRIEDYSTMGDTLFILRSEDLRDTSSLERTLARIANAIDAKGHRTEARRVLRLLDDPARHAIRAEVLGSLLAQSRLRVASVNRRETRRAKRKRHARLPGNKEPGPAS